MIPAIQGVCLFLLGLAPPAEVETRFEQVLPRPGMASLFPGRVGRRRAVVLIHGLYLHPFSKENAGRPLLRDWQTPRSHLAHELAKDSDVYAFAYAQNVPVDEVARGGRLLESVRFLRSLDYREIVLVGHSAGGVVARQFVEDHPEEGVTKVIQVCTPNGGSSLAKWPASCGAQRVFLQSLTKPERQQSLQARQAKRVPAGVGFVCVVGMGAGEGDGVVRRDCQWTEDLRSQGIPAVTLPVVHPQAMRSAKTARLLAELVSSALPRWSAKQVEQARKGILGE
jgi:pimeloyl-ACP methyl ester carboxylesterase